ncbi:class I SAM-dependent methyltransferase [Dyella soli]|uniref:Class I SAM-dependent methyltransferase n=1 Tax=Dyella soli TaxID=522319 RepID=A0A4R0YX33_9GAMM|nr:class I SAM-dependent methyltransferase [Dyella soli]TCI11212.1 class I SAM-dependent methyltransferase [Dyella soli]
MMRLRRWAQDVLQEGAGLDVTRSSFYSPIVDRAEVRDRAISVWSPQTQSPTDMPGLDFRPDHQATLLAGPLGGYMRECRFAPDAPADGTAGYYPNNGQFGEMDARMLTGMLRHYAPRRVVEVGSGFSTIVMNDVVASHFRGAMSVTAIEPFPRPFLATLPHVQLVQSKVQDVGMATFEQLESGDVLFIDSSHVSKTGSDVNHLFFHVLPRLRPGVLIHIHDIWLPLEYPEQWVLTEARSWNEQYVLRALLTGSHLYDVELAGIYLSHFQRPLLEATLGDVSATIGVGSSFWIRKVG